MPGYDRYYDLTPEERAEQSREIFWFLVLVFSFLIAVIALIVGLWKQIDPVVIIAVVVGIPAMGCSLINACGHPRPKLVVGMTVFIVLTIGGGIYLMQHTRTLHQANAGSHSPLL